MNNVPRHKFLHFGPVLCGTSVDPKLIDELLKRGNKTKIDHRHKLAGHLDHENRYPVEDMVWFAENFKQYFIPYFKKLQDQNDNNYYYGRDGFNRILIQTLWINFQKKNEFNPYHTHGGAFSFVIYLDVPKELDDEIKRFKGTGVGPGSISFLYGEEQKGIITGHGVRPVKNDMWMFPASLKHMVPPFKSDVTRISVSGNIFITDELNAKEPLQPGEFFLNNIETVEGALRKYADERHKTENDFGKMDLKRPQK